MLVSTKGRYALRVIVDLAEHEGEGYLPLRDIAHRLDISEKYLESVLKTLVRDHLIEGMRGKGGGYRLTRPAADYTAGEVLRSTEGSLAPVAGLDDVGPSVRRNPVATICGRSSTHSSRTTSMTSR